MIRYALLAALLLPAAASAQTAAADSALVEQLSREGIRHAAAGVVVINEPGALTDAEVAGLAGTLARGLAAAAAILGHGLDGERYGSDTLFVVVSREVTISHVYGAYRHMEHPRPYLFLDPEKVRDGSAPYLHEATHLLAWRFGSLSLREGFASYMEARLSADLGLASPALFGVSGVEDADRRAAEMLAGPAAAQVLPWIGRTGTPDAAVTSSENRRSRAAFYVLSQSFVQHLVGALGMERFLAVYAAMDPEAALRTSTGRTLESWKEEWVRTLAAPRP